MTAPVDLGAMPERQRASWLGLLDVADFVPSGWCLVGGQMVFLICRERNFSPTRTTNDGDVALDVRARPQMLAEFTGALVRLGFDSAGVSPDGHQHRWIRGDASINVLIPDHLGARAAARTGATGGTTVQSPGAQQALARAERVVVRADERIGTVWRPSVLGALVAKAAAFSVPADPDKDRHLSDFAVLASAARRSDHLAEGLTRRDRKYLVPMLEAMESNHSAWAGVEGAGRGVRALSAIVDDAWAYTSDHRALLERAHADSREGRVQRLSERDLESPAD